MKIGPLVIEWKNKKSQIIDALKESKIVAVKKARQLHGWSLKQAIDYVNKLEGEQ